MCGNWVQNSKRNVIDQHCQLAAKSHTANCLFSKKENAFSYNISGQPANAQPVNLNDCRGNIANTCTEKVLSTHKTNGQGSELNNTVYKVDTWK